MTMKEWFFEKKIGSSTSVQHGLRVAKGNEIRVLRASIGSTATAANQDSVVIPLNNRYLLTRMSIRPSTAIVDGATTTGVVKVSYATQGTSVLADSLLTCNLTTAALGATTATSTDITLQTPLALPGGTYAVLRNVAAAGGSVAGVVEVTVWATETDPNTNS